MRERDIQKSILEFICYLPGLYVWRNNTMGVFDPAKGTYRTLLGAFSAKGSSDILGLMAPNGRFFACEVKVPGRKPTEHQSIFLEKINALGGLGFVATGISDVKAVLEKQEGPWQKAIR